MAKILIVDDDEAVRTMLCLTLAKAGHNAVGASNGNDGLKRFAESRPDLVITDIVMPEKDGLELLLELKRRGRSVKIIAMSGGGRMPVADYLQMATLLGAATVLTKPISRETFLAAVHELLERDVS